MSSRIPLQILDWRQRDRALTLAVEGYQFPGNTDPYDNEWVVVSGRVECAEGSWHFRDPCFMSSELPEVADVLERGYVPGETVGTSTTEPVIEFDWIRPGTMRVTFRLEAAPPWDFATSEKHASGAWGFPVVFELSGGLAKSTVETLRIAAADFPPQRRNVQMPPQA